MGNIYAPNKAREQCSFFEKLQETFDSFFYSSRSEVTNRVVFGRSRGSQGRVNRAESLYIYI